ncbi:MAG: FUSC family protein [Candidatus Xenobiia bacterium LiM19]
MTGGRAYTLLKESFSASAVIYRGGHFSEMRPVPFSAEGLLLRFPEKTGEMAFKTFHAALRPGSSKKGKRRFYKNELSMTRRLSFREIVHSELSASLRLRLALKTAIACIIGEMAVIALHLSQGYWVIITFFVVMQFTVSTTTKKALMRIVGTASGCIVGLVLVTLIPERHSLILSVLSVWCMVLLYVSLRGVYPYACLLAALTPMVIAFTGSGHMPGTASLALSRFTDIAVGSTIAWLVTIFVMPVSEMKEINLNSGRLIRDVPPSTHQAPDEEFLISMRAHLPLGGNKIP